VKALTQNARTSCESSGYVRRPVYQGYRLKVKLTGAQSVKSHPPLSFVIATDMAQFPCH